LGVVVVVVVVLTLQATQLVVQLMGGVLVWAVVRLLLQLMVARILAAVVGVRAVCLGLLLAAMAALAAPALLS
jgi:hypothetical protein